MFKDCITRLRILGCIEGISYLVLLLIAMPLKYIAEMPSMVTWVGWAHGILFVLYCFIILEVKITKSWGVWISTIPFIAALIPFGTFLIDGWLKRKNVN